MKKITWAFLLFSMVALCCFYACAPRTVAATSERVLTEADYNEMIDNYDGKFRKHTKTDGLLIKAEELVKLLTPLGNQEVSIMFARYANGEVVNDKTKRVTLLLKTHPNGIDKAPAYIDLGRAGTLCPLPHGCAPAR